MRVGVLASITLLVLAACRPAPPPAPAPPGVGPPLAPGAGASPLGPSTSAVRHEHCGAPVLPAEALPDPVRLPDRDGEWLRLVNPSPAPVSLDGWELRAGRRSLALDGLVAPPAGSVLVGGPHGRRPLGSVRLRNGRGGVALVDPCGQQVARLSWGEPGCVEAGPATRVVHPAPWPGKREGPARRVPGGASGGCGQI